MKAVCVLESILRKKDDAHFATIASYFSDNREVVVKCSESPQSSLREKANRVLIFVIYSDFLDMMWLEAHLHCSLYDARTSCGYNYYSSCWLLLDFLHVDYLGFSFLCLLIKTIKQHECKSQYCWLLLDFLHVDYLGFSLLSC